MFYFVFLVIISVGFVSPRPDEVDFLHVDPAQGAILNNILKNCARKFGVDSITTQKVKEWKFEDNEPENKLLYCFVTISGYADEDGHFYKEKVSQLVDDGNKSKDEMLHVIDECNKLEGTNKYKTTYKVVNCFRHKSPILFTF